MRRVLTKEEREAIQQPLDKDGYSNEYFSELYGKDKNPYVGTERDRKNKKARKITITGMDKYKKGWEVAFGKKKTKGQKIWKGKKDNFYKPQLYK